jgi:predicted RNA methylase
MGMKPMMESDSHGERIFGSFRDPSGFVFRHGERVFRALDDECAAIVGELKDDGLLDRLQRDQLIVDTCFVDDESLRSTLAETHRGYETFLEHEVLTNISYPYEWSVSMLADAGVHTIDVQLELLKQGFALKDATAYNVQFVSGKPIFIDISSFERPKRQDVWFALGQFQRMFLFPLLLNRYSGWDLQSYFLPNLDGLDVERVAAIVGFRRRYSPRLLLDVGLPALLGRWADRQKKVSRDLLDKPRQDSSAQIINLRRLRSKVLKLASAYRVRGVWAEYTTICNYDEAAENAKKMLVKEFLLAEKPDRVTDLGCNTGDYSRLAAECGAKVTAVDADHDAIELLYRSLKDKPAPISPMVIDLCNPSPGIGLLNRERPSFLERNHADCVFALALIHHLLVSGNLSLAAIRDLMCEVTQRDLVLEFVPVEDSMFQRLLKFRVNLFGDLTLDNCRNVFLQRFDLLREVPIPGSKRTLLFLRKR